MADSLARLVEVDAATAATRAERDRLQAECEALRAEKAENEEPLKWLRQARAELNAVKAAG